MKRPTGRFFHFRGEMQENECPVGSAQAARLLGVSKKTMAVWRARGVGPAVHYAGEKPIYYQSELRIWIDECTSRKLRETL